MRGGSFRGKPYGVSLEENLLLQGSQTNRTFYFDPFKKQHPTKFAQRIDNRAAAYGRSPSLKLLFGPLNPAQPVVYRSGASPAPVVLDITLEFP
jgi:hypothetical protein